MRILVTAQVLYSFSTSVVRTFSDGEKLILVGADSIMEKGSSVGRLTHRLCDRGG